MLNVRIAARRQLADNICSFELVSEDGHALPAFSAGAHIDVHLPGGLVRQYSLCNSPQQTNRYEIGVLKDPKSRGGSEAMHRLVEGSRLQISEPKNHFPLAENASHSIFLAGGIGITPLMSMVERLLSSDRSFELHYCIRSRRSGAFIDRLCEIQDRCLIFLHPDDEPEKRFDPLALFQASQPTSEIYVCGPQGFIEYTLGAARIAGFAEERLHREYFANHIGTAEGEDRAFDIEIASTGHRFTVAANETVLTAFLRNGIEVPVSCEQGVCGTCLTRILAGEPLHRDIFLTDEERLANDQFTPCCSRAQTPLLVLDL